MILNNEELININGGSFPSGAVVQALVKMITLVFDIGKAIGSAINMNKSGVRC